MSGRPLHLIPAELRDGDRVLVNGGWYDFERVSEPQVIGDHEYVDVWFSHYSAVYGWQRCTQRHRLTVDRARYDHEPAVAKLLDGEREASERRGTD